MGARSNAARALALCGVLGGVLHGAGCGSKSGLLVPDPGDSGAPAVPDAGVPSQPALCGAFSIKADLAALDVFISLDTSGSMGDHTASGHEKLDAVRDALEDFMQDPASAGIGVTIAFFPIVDALVPELCVSDLACGQPDACEKLNLCYPSTAAFCNEDSDCSEPGDSCEPLGFCGGNVNEVCVVGKLACSSGAECLAGGWCENRVVCDPVAYQPASPPIALPGGAAGVMAALNAKQPEGGTPTLPALQGSIAAAVAHSKQLPDHKAIVLLATDGFPTSCDPAATSPGSISEGIPKVVAAATAGKDSGIQTFVIGVFAPEEAVDAQTNLDAIALAGGSEAAYVIQTSEPVSQKFLATLNAIRSAASACDYALPKPGGKTLDAQQIQVRLVSAAGEVWLERRDSLAECDPVSGGFFFDKSPFGPEPPARVQLCPASCAKVDADPELEVEVVIPCDGGA